MTQLLTMTKAHKFPSLVEVSGERGEGEGRGAQPPGAAQEPRPGEQASRPLLKLCLLQGRD